MTPALSSLLSIFVAVFLAELGDKTQLAAMTLSASGQTSPWLVFLAASLALVLSTACAVLLGNAASSWLQNLPLKLISGSLFIGLGLLMIVQHVRMS
jgi:putative Ca2+/H+ antiporter (TMEM165/GDT1 family)